MGVLSDLFGKCKSVTKIVLVRISQERQGLYGEPPLLVDDGESKLFGGHWTERIGMKGNPVPVEIKGQRTGQL